MYPDSDYLKELENLTIELEKKIERVSRLLKKILEDYHKTSESLLKELLIIFEHGNVIAVFIKSKCGCETTSLRTKVATP